MAAAIASAGMAGVCRLINDFFWRVATVETTKLRRWADAGLVVVMSATMIGGCTCIR